MVRAKYSQVALTSGISMPGGGSGHEPAHAGYVGPGMLTAAVCGAGVCVAINQCGSLGGLALTMSLVRGRSR